MVAAVVKDTAEHALAQALVKHADDVLGVVVAILIRHNIGRLHVPGVQLGTSQRHLGVSSVYWVTELRVHSCDVFKEASKISCMTAT